MASKTNTPAPAASWIADVGPHRQRDRQPIDRREQRDGQVQPIRNGESAHVDRPPPRPGSRRGRSAGIRVNAPLNMPTPLDGAAFQFVTAAAMSDFDVLIVGGGIAGASLGAEIAGKRAHADHRGRGPLRLPFDRAVGGILARKLWRGASGAADLRVARIPWQARPSIFPTAVSCIERGALHIVGRRLARSPAERDRLADPARRTGGDGSGHPRRTGSRRLLEPGCADIDVAGLPFGLPAQVPARGRRGRDRFAIDRRRAGRRVVDGAAGRRLERHGANPRRCRGRLGRPRRASVRSRATRDRAQAADDGPASSRAGGPQGPAAGRRLPTAASTSRAKATGRVWLSPHDEIATDPCDAAPEEIDIAIAIDRFESVVDWPVEAVERRWAGLRSFAPDRLPVYGFDPRARGFFWCAGQGGFGHPDRARGGKLAAAVLLGEEPDAMVAQIDPAIFSPARFRAALKPVVRALAVGLGAGERVDPVVLGMAAVALDPVPFDAVRRASASTSSCHRSAFLTGFLSEVRQPFCRHLWIQRVMPSRT